MAVVARIAAVSYLNTIPFIYGIEHADDLQAKLLLTPPAGCARNFSEGLADIALVPAAAVPTLSDAEVVTSYCIGAAGPVRTVVLLCNEPVQRIRRVFMDSHSLTSVQLAGYLFANHWRVAPEFYALTDYERLRDARAGDAFVLIGDKVFDHEGIFSHSYDLAGEWIKATGLPFAFAVWVARKGADPAAVDALERALTYGIEHTYEAVLEHGFDRKPYDAYDYLTRHIDYLLDDPKRRALRKFWDSGIKIAPKP